MVHIPRSYDLGSSEVVSILSALKGQGTQGWIDRLDGWLSYRNKQMLVYRHTFDWLFNRRKAAGNTEVLEDWYKDEDDAIKDRVYHEMEYTPFVWSEKDGKAIREKYNGNGTPYMKDEEVIDLLAYVNEKIESGTQPLIKP